MDYEKAFKSSCKSAARAWEALRECQIALCPDFETCADNLNDGEKCACGFEDGPFANAVPKNRAADFKTAE